MIDARVAAQIARTDVFVVEFREMVAATAVDPASPSADARRRGLERIAATLDAVPAISRLGLSRVGNERPMRRLNLKFPVVLLGLALIVGAGPAAAHAESTLDEV